MNVRTDEIGHEIYRFSTFVPEIAAPLGFTFNQYLIVAEQPLVFHTGPRMMFRSILEAVSRIVSPSKVKWISFGHVESDECGSMNQWLAAAPEAQVCHGATACLVSLNDLADRPPRVLADGEVLDLGGKRVRLIDTPHVPHAWESGLVYEETTGTLFSGDLLAHLGNGAAITHDSIVEPAVIAEEMFKSTSLTPRTAPIIRELAALKPRRLAVMHGSCFEGDCEQALLSLANYYETSLRSAERRAQG